MKYVLYSAWPLYTVLRSHNVELRPEPGYANTFLMPEWVTYFAGENYPAGWWSDPGFAARIDKLISRFGGWEQLQKMYTLS